jgi:metal-responsive CopG/Arc/MetJ family transcriptional regulator
MENRKLERVVVLCSAEDVQRINEYCTRTGKNRSVFIRDLVMAKVATSEKAKRDAKLPSAV